MSKVLNIVVSKICHFKILLIKKYSIDYKYDILIFYTVKQFIINFPFFLKKKTVDLETKAIPFWHQNSFPLNSGVT